MIKEKNVLTTRRETNTSPFLVNRNVSTSINIYDNIFLKLMVTIMAAQIAIVLSEKDSYLTRYERALNLASY